MKTLPIKNWILPKKNTQNIFLINELVKKFKFHPLIAEIFINRSINTFDKIYTFLYPSLKDLYDPFLMKNIDIGIKRLIKAIIKKEIITIYGDYDVDGICSVVILFKFLKEEVKSNIYYYIPNRIKEGYGLNYEAIDKIQSNGTSLIITVDCGTSNNNEILYASRKGIDIIIIDHHKISKSLPQAIALINNQQLDCSFPFKNLAGVGVVFNFLIALRHKLQKIGFWGNIKTYPNLKKYLDLVALGTIADGTPLINENRIFVKIGLELINNNNNCRIGIQALINISHIKTKINSNIMSFQIIPKINAAGRIASAEDAIKLLITNNFIEAMNIAHRLNDYNNQRKEIQKKIFIEAISLIESNEKFKNKPILILSSKNWHVGVIGIIAAKLANIYLRTVVIISINNNGLGKGSIRSNGIINLNDILSYVEKYLLAKGGHKYAAGILILEKNIKPFYKFLLKLFKKNIINNKEPKLIIDIESNLFQINQELIEQLALFEPFGNMNSEPIFYTNNILIKSSTLIKKKHLQLDFLHSITDYNKIYSIWFEKGFLKNYISKSFYDITFTPLINKWKGLNKIQLKIHDIKKTI